MAYRGHVKNGVVVFEGLPALPDGTVVQIEPLVQALRTDNSSVFDRLEELAGTLKGLPPDLARNHDHYVHRHLRRSRAHNAQV